jgi:hypothetical protein
MAMRKRNPLPSRIGGAALATFALAVGATAFGQTPVTTPEPTVPEIFTLEGQYVRVAYNNEGFATMGYRFAQSQVGQEWILLQVGVTLRKPAKTYTIKREHFWVTTPDGKKVPLATQQEYRGGMGAITSLNLRAKVNPDSINYFPVDASRACPLSFFADDRSRNLAFDQTDLSWSRACLGRLYFKIPGGLQTGQHWLHIQFATSSLQVPFRILTKAEEKEFSDRWEDLKKEHDATFKQ